ncbi:MAG: peptidoglycan D,D-transpeptidase FtsI family protein [Candidatus Limnocylindrales bacterium]
MQQSAVRERGRRETRAMLGRTDSRRRLLLLLLVLLVGSGGLLLRLTYWQVAQHERLVSLAREQVALRDEVPAVRGTIFDRSGTVVLASTVQRDRLVGSPADLTPARRSEVAKRLVTILGLAGAAAAQLRTAMTSDQGYVLLAHGLEAATSQRIRDGLVSGDLTGVSLEPEQVRVYPQTGGAPKTSLASQLLGFVNLEGVGQYGVEQYYQDLLAGKPEILVADRDVAGQPVTDTSRIVEPGVPGGDLRLTVDAGLQLALEQEVFAAFVADRAASVSALVMDPKTGAVLASSSYPTYDANDFGATASSDPSRFLDPIVSAVYEPGSVFKMLTAIAGLQKGVVTPQTRINDSGSLGLAGGTRVWDADKRAMGSLTLADVLAYSRNVGAARVALLLGKTTVAAAQVLFRAWRTFGFGQPTGVDLAGEVSGLVNDPAVQPCRQIDLANGAFGQGVAVTPIQLAAAYSTMVNGGFPVRPHVVAATGDQDRTPAVGARVMDQALSQTMVQLMQHVASSPWYRDGTLLSGYNIGGKSGTAQIWDPTANSGKGDWKANDYDYSWVGFVGRQHPDAIIVVVLREAKPTRIAQGVLPLPVPSYELFRRLATDTMTALHLSPLASLTPATPALPASAASGTSPSAAAAASSPDQIAPAASMPPAGTPDQ